MANRFQNPKRRRVLSQAAAALVLVAVLAGCGGDKKPADPGRDVLGAFIQAAVDGDKAAMRKQLSPQSNERFTDADLTALGRQLAHFGEKPRFVISERITDGFGLAVVAAGADVYGAAFRKSGDNWGLELKGPVQITPLGPKPGAREREVGQVGVELHHAPGTGVALLYLDRFSLADTRTYRQGDEATVFANLDVMAAAGRHTVTAFATSGGNATARAWTFVVPR